MITMTESEFNQRVDALFLQFEEAIDGCGVDIDYENVSGILTLEFNDDTKVILNRQTAVRQVWLAARSGGFHFYFDAETGNWLCDSNGVELEQMLSDVCSAQSGERVVLS